MAWDCSHLLYVVVITSFPIITSLDPFAWKPLVDVYQWGSDLVSWTIIRIPYVGSSIAALVDPWIWANILMFPMIYIISTSALNMFTINRQRVMNAKERLRIKRRNAMDQADQASARRDIAAAIRFLDRAIRFALHASEDEVALELAAKINELIKLLPQDGGKKKKKGKGKGKGKGGKGKGGISAAREREKAKEEQTKLAEQMNDFVKKAEEALAQEDFHGAAKFYAEAVNVARNAGDRDAVLQFSQQAEELEKMAQELKKK